jgi:hypothetical protein
MRNAVQFLGKTIAGAKKPAILFCFLAAALLPLFAKIIADTIEEKLEYSPIDYETHGEDVAYNYWLRSDYDRFESVREGWSQESDKYRENQLSISVKPSGETRDSLFARKDNSEYPAKIISGTMFGNRFSYFAKDVKTGGVKLSRIRSVLLEGRVDGITIDDGKVLLSTIRSRESPPDGSYPDDFLVIMKSVFESGEGGPWVTIDPPQDPALRRQYGEVRYGLYIQNTHVGAVLFEADRLMKTLSLGYDNRNGKKLSIPSWHKSEFDFDDFSGMENTEWNRFWFTTDETVVEVDAANKTAHIQGRPFTVKTEKMVMADGTLRTSLVQDMNSAAGRWCNFFDQNITRYYEHYLVFSELERIMRIAAALQGLKACGVVFQDIALPNTALRGTPTTVKTATISTLKIRTVTDETGNKRSTSQMTQNIIGGVGLRQVKIVQKDLSAYKHIILSGYNSGNKNIERIF